ncbi:hypothetical protein CPC08DRAFT_725092 [Agrocybe pediades]|nr:hypothetical protein CPC08DRAFT_725092 [Agrocybe pediades]
MVSVKLSIFAVIPALVSAAVAVCPGYNFAIGHEQDLGQGVSRWMYLAPVRSVYSTDCKSVDGLNTTYNPCTQGIFGCSPAPIIFNSYTNSFSGLKYYCSNDPNAGRCGNDAISVCVGSSHTYAETASIRAYVSPTVPQRWKLVSYTFLGGKSVIEIANPLAYLYTSPM